MMKNICSVWKINKKERIIMLLTLIVCGIIGMGMMLLLCFTEVELPFLALGAIFAVVLWMLINLCLSLFSYQNTFDLIVSMGCRRKDFIISQIITVYINMLFELGVIGFIYLIEKMLYRFVYSAYGIDDITSYLWKPKMIWILFMLIPACRLLLEALILKYKKKAFWILWAIWMVCSLGCGRFITYLLENQQSLIVVVITNVMNMSIGVQMLFALVLTSAMLAVTYFLSRKHAVFM